MDARVYLKSYGWIEGEALKKGGLKKPILVKHKKDTKGLGHETKDTDLWWEKLFDGQLKGLEVNKEAGGSVSFSSNTEIVADTIRKSTSPLYKMFVRGQGLKGTVGSTSYTNLKSMTIDAKKAIENSEKILNKQVVELDDEAKDKKKKDKKEKKSKKKDKKERKDKKEKKEKKSKEDNIKPKESSKRKRSSSNDVDEKMIKRSKSSKSDKDQKKSKKNKSKK